MATGMANPYLPQMGQAITNQVNTNLQQQQLPSINSGAMAAGGFGGSRQGIAQGLAINGANQALSNSLSNLYGQSYQFDQGLNAQKQMQQAQLAAQQKIAEMQNQTALTGLNNQFTLGQGQLALGNRTADQNYSLGQGNLALGNKQADNSYALGQGQLGLNRTAQNQNFYTQQRGQDMQALGLGAQLFGLGQGGLANQGLGLSQAGQTQYNAGAQPIQNYGGMISPFTGLNGSSSTTIPGAGTANNAIGGALTGAQLWQLLMGGN